MLGNWSFGDYFKAEAIEWAWEFLVDVIGLDPANLYATVFEGSEAEGLSRDDEAASFWAKHLPADHIINGNKHDNFWEMGDTGPCGPCSEIHIDLRPESERKAIPGASLVNKDHPQVIEIWNLVFMQYNRLADGSLHPLPAKVIDTGMGFERLCMALQGKTSNYDTDVFTPLISKIADLSGKEYGKDANTDVAMRVVADHVRTIAFSIADSQLPSNAKAGYVIRRILRRAVRYAYTFLGQKQAFMYRLIDTLIESMGEAYPELVAQRDLIMRVIKEEEDSFLRTLANGIALLDAAIAKARAEGKTQISGKEAFVLYDTYGFPLDLTELILKENGMTLDKAEFDTEMAAQKARARNAAAVEATDWTELPHRAETYFHGYDYDECETYISRYRKVKQKGKEYYELVLESTPFYGEMGGQVGDRGTLEALDDSLPRKQKTGEVIEIFDTKRENGQIIHLAHKLPSHPEGAFIAAIDREHRRAVESNHSATHLLHAALREVLGTHVEQKGSYVSAHELRFRLLALPEGDSRGAAQGRAHRQRQRAQGYRTQGAPRYPHRGGPRDGRDGTLRRERRRERTRNLLRRLGRALRRYPREQYRQNRHDQDCQRELGGSRRAAYRGHHRRSRGAGYRRIDRYPASRRVAAGQRPRRQGGSATHPEGKLGTAPAGRGGVQRACGCADTHSDVAGHHCQRCDPRGDARDAHTRCCQERGIRRARRLAREYRLYRSYP